MATKKSKAPEPQPNREQRRREKFGKTGTPGRAGNPDEPWPETTPNPAFGRGGDDQEAYAGRPDQGVKRTTGPGAGGATESDERLVGREGIHGGNSAKG